MRSVVTFCSKFLEARLIDVSLIRVCALLLCPIADAILAMSYCWCSFFQCPIANALLPMPYWRHLIRAAIESCSLGLLIRGPLIETSSSICIRALHLPEFRALFQRKQQPKRLAGLFTNRSGIALQVRYLLLGVLLVTFKWMQTLHSRLCRVITQKVLSQSSLLEFAWWKRLNALLLRSNRQRIFTKKIFTKDAPPFNRLNGNTIMVSHIVKQHDSLIHFDSLLWLSASTFCFDYPRRLSTLDSLL